MRVSEIREHIARHKQSPYLTIQQRDDFIEALMTQVERLEVTQENLTLALSEAGDALFHIANEPAFVATSCPEPQRTRHVVSGDVRDVAREVMRKTRKVLAEVDEQGATQ